MPHIDLRIARAWRQKSETDRIHYVAVRADGSERRLYADAPSGLYKLLDNVLVDEKDYTGPKSGEAEEE